MGFTASTSLMIRGLGEAAPFAVTPLRNRQLSRHLPRHSSLSNGEVDHACFLAHAALALQLQLPTDVPARSRMTCCSQCPALREGARQGYTLDAGCCHSETVNGNGREGLD